MHRAHSMRDNTTNGKGRVRQYLSTRLQGYEASGTIKIKQEITPSIQT